MPRRFLKKVLPKQGDIQGHKSLKYFKTLLHLPYLWQLNRNSVSRGVAIGMFWAFIPMPFQMLPATLCAIQFRGNLLVSVALVWLTNPITMPPVMYFTYQVGRLILGDHAPHHEPRVDVLWFWEMINEVWWPLLTGSLVVAISLSILGYFIVNQLWRYSMIYRWVKRSKNYQTKHKS